ncbi:MAG: C-GCAxxG-C-C family protein [Candidatus Sumerlaeota bacterium]|nr:C-GCAxxG-C-C family protein [Candidatus Sumerlaeota bacterium]
MNVRSEIAVQKFLSGYNCAQSVLYSFCGDFGLDRELALKLATGLGAGIARRQGTCGAVTGGILVIGLKHGRGERDDKAVADEAYAKAQELMERFEAKHGSCICLQLLGGCDFNAPESLRFFYDNDLLNRICKPCVETVVGILEGII